MSRKRPALWAFISPKFLTFLSLIFATLALTSCDRGAGSQVDAARKFADAVSRNDTARRDSMIATYKFKEYFQNPYVASDMMSWLRTIYDYQNREFRMMPSADVDRDLQSDLEGSLIDTAAVEETGVVKVKSPTPSEESAVFWMVHQRGRPWKVAIVTKGELQVNFH